MKPSGLISCALAASSLMLSQLAHGQQFQAPAPAWDPGAVSRTLQDMRGGYVPADRSPQPDDARRAERHHAEGRQGAGLRPARGPLLRPGAEWWQPEAEGQGVQR
jgi:hypothetical protein